MDKINNDANNVREVNAEYDGYFGFDSWNCPHCGCDVTNRPNFCPRCGLKLKYERHNPY